MPIKVFISFSIDKKEGPRQTRAKKWADDLKTAIQGSSEYKSDEIYVYLDDEVAQLGSHIPTELSEAIKGAEHLLCVISDEYLGSAWCMEEYRQYTSRTDIMHKPPVFVLSNFLNEAAYDQKPDLEERLRIGIDSMKDRLSEDQVQFADTVWIKAVVDHHKDGKRALDLFKSDWKDAKRHLSSRLVRPRAYFILQHAGLSAYCLGADRYVDGGWGFSLANTLCYDREDGEDLPNGSYGLNVVILRALDYFLEPKEMIQERQAVFPVEWIERSSLQVVDDRLPRFAGLMAWLEHADHSVTDLYLYAKGVEESLVGYTAESRWKLANRNSVDRSEEYYAAVLSCLGEVEDLKGDDAGKRYLKVAKLFHNDPLQKYSDSPHKHSDPPQKETFEKHCQRTLSENDLIAKLAAHPSSDDPDGLDDAFRASMLWLMLSRSSVGQGLLAGHTNAYVNKSRFSADIGNSLVKRTSECMKQDDLGALTLLLALCASILPCAAIAGTFPAKLLDALHEHLFDRVDCYKIVPRLNAVAWASIILIAKHESEQSIQSTNLKRLWSAGLRLRGARLEYVKELSDRRELSARRLNLWKYPFLLAQVRDWVDRPDNLFDRISIESDEQLEAFAEALTNASFWGATHEPDHAIHQNGTLGGVLRVACETGTVQMDSPGYNQIFLRPFSRLTGMNVLDLNGIRREFGGLDRKLVELMGETVVQRVYVRTGDKYKYNGSSFLDRTAEITKQLTDNWRGKVSLGEGIDDLLKVRRTEDDPNPRLIHRSAIVHSTRKQGGVGVISWRFVEMPATAACLLVEPDETA